MKDVKYSKLKLIDAGLKKIKTKVCLIFTGGTIGMIPKYPDNPNIKSLKPASLGELLEIVPDLGKLDSIQLGMVSFQELVDSSDVTSKHWIAMAKIIKEYYDSFDGFVILHGTDTMAFTSSALSFMLNNLSKPVVVTGSQLPIKDPRTDGVQNLVSAVKIAGYKATELPLIPEVSLCFRDHLLRGNRATKYSSSKFNAFISPNYPPIGELGEEINIREDLILKNDNKQQRDFFILDKLNKNIKVILVNPGITPEQLENDFKTKGIDAVILLTYGTGNMQTTPSFIKVISEAVKGGEGYNKKIPVINVTQCMEGKVEMGLYEASSGLLDAGVISGLDLTYEAALGKLNWALSRFNDSEIIKNQLQFSQRGEQKYNIHDVQWRWTEPKDFTVDCEDDYILTEHKNIPGKFSNERLTSATLRIQDFKILINDSKNDFSIKIFLNAPDVDRDTSRDCAEFVYEINDLDEIIENENLVTNISKVSKNVIEEGRPVHITIIAENASISCGAIYLSLFTDTES